jgi:hypothetical protein
VCGIRRQMGSRCHPVSAKRDWLHPIDFSNGQLAAERAALLVQPSPRVSCRRCAGSLCRKSAPSVLGLRCRGSRCFQARVRLQPHVLLQLVLFGMQTRTFGPYLAAIHRIPVPAMLPAAASWVCCLMLVRSRASHDSVPLHMHSL